MACPGTRSARDRLRLRARLQPPCRVPVVDGDRDLPRREPSPNRRRPRALHGTVAQAHRARVPAGVRRYHPAQRGQQRLPPFFRVHPGGAVPARRVETRQLARRRVDAARPADRRRAGFATRPDRWAGPGARVGALAARAATTQETATGATTEETATGATTDSVNAVSHGRKVSANNGTRKKLSLNDSNHFGLPNP